MNDLKKAARKWRASVERADVDRERLIVAVREAIAAGMSEREAARVVDVQRMTIRAWLGK